VTEFAGDSGVVDTDGLWSSAWDDGAIEALGASPEQAIDVLADQGLVDCDGWGSDCEWRHPLLQAIVNRYLPVPDGWTERAFYACLSCAMAEIDPAAWDAAGLAADTRERIIDPGARALEALADSSYLTALYTTLSPHEMTLDPTFHPHDGLPTVTNQHIGTSIRYCGGGATFEFPGDRNLVLGNVWPTWGVEMPWAEETAQAGMVGPWMPVVDNTELIDCLLDDWNGGRECPSAGSGSGGDDGGWEDGEGGEGGSGGQGQAGSVGGCACQAGFGSGALAPAVLLLGLGRRRRSTEAPAGTRAGGR
jgi:MYXO-CTERM domain-containing protein